MARTFIEIQDGIKSSYITERAAAGLVADDPAAWSKVNIKRLIVYVVSFAVYVLELMFDKQREETEIDLANLRSPTVGWYAAKALAYQHGFPLIKDTDQFDNTGYTETEIEASKVIKYSGMQRQVDVNGYVLFLRMKLAGSDGNELAQLDNDVLAGFGDYLKRFEAAGDNVIFLSRVADKVKMKWRIFYSPLILKADGSRQDGTSQTPVQDAIAGFLKNGMPFNGRYSITSHVDYVQKVLGVNTPVVDACSASYESLPFQDISEFYLPDAGWMRFDDIDIDLEIEYIADSI